MELCAMNLRSIVLPAALAALALAPVTALANDRGPSEMTQRLRDPEMQRGMAGALAAMTEAMMNIDLAPFAAAMDATGDHRSARRLRHGGTLRALAGRDAERVPQEMSRRLPQMMNMMAGMAGAMEAMMPQLEAMGAQMGAAIDSAAPGQDPAESEPPAGEATAE
jgi:hypothetical protein